MRQIVFTNDKGGVGKTTTVVNLAVGLSDGGVRTMVVTWTRRLMPHLRC